MTISTETLLLAVMLFAAMVLGGLCGLALYTLRRMSQNRRLAILVIGELLTIGLLAITEPSAAGKTLAFLAVFNAPVLFALSEITTKRREDKFLDEVIEQAKTPGEL